MPKPLCKRETRAYLPSSSSSAFLQLIYGTIDKLSHHVRVRPSVRPSVCPLRHHHLPLLCLLKSSRASASVLLNKAADRCARRARDSAADIRRGPSGQSLHEYILFFGGLKQRLQPSRKCAEKEVSFCLTLDKHFWITPGRAFNTVKRGDGDLQKYPASFPHTTFETYHF